ncbi:NAD/NADP transhydrogenase alpha subunit-like protein [Azospirillum brasilense]|uniref:NAD/NADP transhydrogenase alpha subunit-like protein n=1 Tax=Azospirillum brasilense TaxID=192 RepID=UPI000E0A35D6|nr:NAD/NADP transhydrogenase alpha subunit-like protein [Azospirillum brasilense]
MLDFRTHDDSMGQSTPTIEPSDSRHVIALAAGVPKVATVPTGARRVLISATADVWLQYGAAAALPTGDVLTGSAPELNPSARMVKGIPSLGLVSATECLVNLCFYG